MDTAREDVRLAPSSPPRKLKKPTIQRDPAEIAREKELQTEIQRLKEQDIARDLEMRSRLAPRYQQDAVRQHYNERPEQDVHARQNSPIFRLRKFNNWVKSVLIAKFQPEPDDDIPPGSLVLDIGCGKGGDLQKWLKAEARGYVGIDIADVSVQQARERYEGIRGRRFPARFFTLDAFTSSVCVGTWSKARSF